MDNLRSVLEKLEPELIEIRRKIHADPEPGFREIKTASLITGFLRRCGFKVSTEIGITGVSASLKGRLPGPVIAFRFDIDAVYVDDAKNVPYHSKLKGLSHNCGHDVHTTIGLGLAKILSLSNGNFKGTVKLIFQPAEEIPFEHLTEQVDIFTERPSGTRGASLCIKEGIMDDPAADMIFGIHCWPGLKTGQIGYQQKTAMAGTGNFHLRIFANGGHAATPHLSADPILTCSHAIVALQTLISRRIKPGTPLVLTCGTIKGGTRRSVIPSHVDVTGTVRGADPEILKDFIPFEMEKILNGICSSFGCTYDLNYAVDIPPVVNDPRLLCETIKSLRKHIGENAVEMDEVPMTADDFAFMAEMVPAVHLKLGVCSKDESTCLPLHSPMFDVDENCLIFAVKTLYNITIDMGDVKL